MSTPPAISQPFDRIYDSGHGEETENPTNRGGGHLAASTNRRNDVPVSVCAEAAGPERICVIDGMELEP